jgi:hypothetical protein
VDCPDFAAFIAEHMMDTNAIYEVGGKETYTYEEMAKLCFRAAGKPVIIKDSPIWMFSILANLPKIKKAGKHDIILFSKWTLSHDLVGDTVVGVGFDAGTSIKAAVEDGTFLGAVTQSPLMMGYYCIYALTAAANGQELIDVPTDGYWYNAENMTDESIAPNLYD